MTNKNQVSETVWFYSHILERVVPCKIERISYKPNSSEDWLYVHCLDLGVRNFMIKPEYAHKTEVQATRAWAENGIKNLQTILDNLKDDTDQMD